MSLRLAWATQQDPILKKQTKQQQKMKGISALSDFISSKIRDKRRKNTFSGRFQDECWIY
jgi:hypothetical protein